MKDLYFNFNLTMQSSSEIEAEPYEEIVEDKLEKHSESADLR